MTRTIKFVVAAIAAGLLMAAPAFACLATPAPEHAWDRGASSTENAKDTPYPKGEEGPMAPIMGGGGEGGIPTASERAGEKFPNDSCENTSMDWCSEGVDKGVTR